MNTAIFKERKILNDTTHLLTFSKEEDMGFVGGQYIIINSKIDNGEGKPFKRAYSIISDEKDQREFQIAYKVMKDGIVTNNFLNHLNQGDEMAYSGPWGKFLKEESYPGPGEILVLATDTGIASTISFLNSKNIKDRTKDVRFIWMVPSSDYFVDYQTIKERIPEGIKDYQIIEIPEMGNSQRDSLLKETKELVSKLDGIKNAFLSGDGIIVRGMKEFLMERGIAENMIGTEVYFNKIRR